MDSRIERINEMEKLFDRVLQTQSAFEKAEIPESVKRGVLSEDGIFDMLEKNKEIMEMIRE